MGWGWVWSEVELDGRQTNAFVSAVLERRKENRRILGRRLMRCFVQSRRDCEMRLWVAVCWAALSGLVVEGAFVYPGRCPGLRWVAPLGLGRQGWVAALAMRVIAEGAFTMLAHRAHLGMVGAGNGIQSVQLAFEVSRLLGRAAVHALRDVPADLPNVHGDEAGEKQPSGANFPDAVDCGWRTGGDSGVRR